MRSEMTEDVSRSTVTTQEKVIEEQKEREEETCVQGIAQAKQEPMARALGPYKQGPGQVVQEPDSAHHLLGSAGCLARFIR